MHVMFTIPLSLLVSLTCGQEGLRHNALVSIHIHAK